MVIKTPKKLRNIRTIITILSYFRPPQSKFSWLENDSWCASHHLTKNGSTWQLHFREILKSITFIPQKTVMETQLQLQSTVTGVWLTTNLILAVDAFQCKEQHHECLCVTLSNVSTLLYLARSQLCTSWRRFRRHTFFPNQLQRDVYFVHGNGRTGAASLPERLLCNIFFTSVPPPAALTAGLRDRRGI